MAATGIECNSNVINIKKKMVEKRSLCYVTDAQSI